MTQQCSVVGAGYVGLSTAAMLVEFGFDVQLIEIDEERVDLLNSGRLPIREPGLADAFARGRAQDRLRCVPPSRASLEPTLAFACVGTPMWHTGDADLSQLESVVDMFHTNTSRTIMVIKSTVPPSTNRMLSDRYPSLRFVSNPEFLRQGSAVRDTLNPDRVILGSNDAEAMATVRKIYQPLADQGIPIIETSPESAELIKYSANALLGIKVAFINEVADLCEAVGADVDDVAAGIGLDPRIGNQFLKAGPGFGGSCFPKDTAALVSSAKRLGSPVTIVDAAARANIRRRASLAHRVVNLVGRQYSDATVGVLGLTFKAGTDDLRESPAVDLTNELADHGVTVTAFDPAVETHPEGVDSRVRVAPDELSVAMGADAVVVATEWGQFSDLDWTKIAESMRGRIVVDYRNIVDRDKVVAAGLELHQVGKPPATPSDPG